MKKHIGNGKGYEKILQNRGKAGEWRIFFEVLFLYMTRFFGVRPVHFRFLFGVFCFLGGAFPVFAPFPSFFASFSFRRSWNLRFLGVFPSFFAVNVYFLWITDAFSWFFYGKRENGRKNRRNFGEFLLFFAFSLSSLGFLAYFLGVFLVRFLWLLRRIGRCRADFCAVFSIFSRYRRFLPALFLFWFLIFCAENKKRQNLSKTMMKNKIYGKLFLFSCFLFFARAIFTWIFAFFAKIACKKYEYYYLYKSFFSFYRENRLEIIL